MNASGIDLDSMIERDEKRKISPFKPLSLSTFYDRSSTTDHMEKSFKSKVLFNNEKFNSEIVSSKLNNDKETQSIYDSDNFSTHSFRSGLNSETDMISGDSDIISSISSPVFFHNDNKQLLPLIDNHEHQHIPCINPRVLSRLIREESNVNRDDRSDGMDIEILENIVKSNKKEKEFSINPVPVPKHYLSTHSFFDDSPLLYRESSLNFTNQLGSERGGVNRVSSVHSVMDEEDISEHNKWIEDSEKEDHWVKNRSNYECLIIDCRYGYEYQGGHIKGALNINKPSLIDFLFKNSKAHMFNKSFLKHLKSFSSTQIDANQLNTLVRNHPNPIQDCFPVVIFHCEYSSKRAPNMWSHLRSIDRKMNEYPNLSYPEMYMLYKGYSNFVLVQGELCEPKHHYTTEKSNEEQNTLCKSELALEWKTISRNKQEKPSKISRCKLDFHY